MNSVLGSHRFTEQDQVLFAEMSGDFNPVHLDQMIARRTMFGSVIVHGAHLVLKMLDAFAGARECQEIFIEKIKAKFPKPVTLENEVSIRVRRETANEAFLETVIGDTVYASCKISFSASQLRKGSQFHSTLTHDRVDPADLKWDDLEGMKGELDLALPREQYSLLFPHLSSKGYLQSDWLSAVLSAVTRVIGMKCPGIHSIFTELSLCVEAGTPREEYDSTLRYRIAELDSRFSRISLELDNADVRVEVVSFFRPPPFEQPSIELLSKDVEKSEFADMNALIIGGTRGIGEVTAKYIAAGGGRVFLTYHRGKSDAERIASEISAFGGECRYAQYDATSPDAYLEQLLPSDFEPDHIFYFASPPIFAATPQFFTLHVYERFQQIYVFAFHELLSYVLSQRSGKKLSVFWPSTVALDEITPGLAEYCVSKAAGEMLCRQLEVAHKNVSIYTPRLPRMETDQTQNLLGVPAENTADVMLKQLRAFLDFSTN